MEYEIGNIDKLEELEVEEIDTELLQNLLEELEDDEENSNKNGMEDNCLVQAAVDGDEAKSNVSQEYFVEQVEGGFVFECSMVDMVESSEEIAEPWYVDYMAWVQGFKYCNNIGDYYNYSGVDTSHNEIVYGCLWEEN